jgi:hypothetical protein
VKNPKQHQKSRKLRYIGLAMVAVLAIALAACTSTSNHPNSAMCGFIVGNGSDGHDTRVHDIVYPNQNVHYDDKSETVKYIPCNSRNYIINNGSQLGADGQPIGDRHTLTQAFTNSGVRVQIGLRAFWTPNQDRDALGKFYEFCFKYKCASDKPESGDVNFSTPGWNGMLAENFAGAMDSAALEAASQIGDDIWRLHKSDLYDELAKKMSDIFATKIRATTGYNVDLFCGSGNSGWANEDKHEGFNCTNVRFQIDSVDVVDAGLASNADAATKAAQDKQTNANRLAAAQAAYGDQAAYWLGLQDTLEKCQAQQTTCILNLGSGTSAPVVGVPTTTKP